MGTYLKIKASAKAKYPRQYHNETERGFVPVLPGDILLEQVLFHLYQRLLD